jgi:hypothetical protein
MWVSNSVPIINGNEKRREKCTYPCTYPGTRELSSCDQAHHGSFKHACQILMRLSRFLMFKTSSVLIEFKQSISPYPRVCLYIGLSTGLPQPAHISRSTCPATARRDAEKGLQSSYHAHAHAMLTPAPKMLIMVPLSLSLYVCFVSSPPPPSTPHALPPFKLTRAYVNTRS